MLTIIAFLIGFLFVAPCGSLFAALIGLGTLIKKSEIWFFGAGLIGAIISLILLRIWFGWLGVPFLWWSYIICMVSVMLYEGQRASAGGSPLYATGTLLGILASIYWGFISPIALVSIQ